MHHRKHLARAPRCTRPYCRVVTVHIRVVPRARLGFGLRAPSEVWPWDERSSECSSTAGRTRRCYCLYGRRSSGLRPAMTRTLHIFRPTCVYMTIGVYSESWSRILYTPRLVIPPGARQLSSGATTTAAANERLWFTNRSERAPLDAF